VQRSSCQRPDLPESAVVSELMLGSIYGHLRRLRPLDSVRNHANDAHVKGDVRRGYIRENVDEKVASRSDAATWW
jgi:hypothetical protein